MKQYTGKTVEEALQAASTETGVEVDELIYIVSDKKKGLFAKKIIVEVYDLSDVIRFAEDYILGVVDALEIESTVNTKLDDQVIRITIDSTHNPILIGRNGKTLQALNELVKLAKTTYTFDPMPADERRAIHNALNNMANVRTESIGEGAQRQVQIIYVE